MDWLLSAEGLAVVRRAYARQMLGIGNIRNDRLELAYATIRREHFLGPEPWQIVQWPPGPLLERLTTACSRCTPQRYLWTTGLAGCSRCAPSPGASC